MDTINGLLLQANINLDQVALLTKKICWDFSAVNLLNPGHPAYNLLFLWKNKDFLAAQAQSKVRGPISQC